MLECSSPEILCCDIFFSCAGCIVATSKECEWCYWDEDSVDVLPGKGRVRHSSRHCRLGRNRIQFRLSDIIETQKIGLHFISHFYPLLPPSRLLSFASMTPPSCPSPPPWLLKRELLDFIFLPTTYPDIHCFICVLYKLLLQLFVWTAVVFLRSKRSKSDDLNEHVIISYILCK